MNVSSRPLPIISFAAAILLLGSTAIGEGIPQLLQADPHYTPAGFFDIHVCNWPDRAPFYMALFSGTHFDQLAAVSVYDPGGTFVGALNMQRYRIVGKKGDPEKRVFITHFPVPAHTRDGWFSGAIRMRDGREYVARDFVVHALLPSASDLVPSGESELAGIPAEFRWAAVPGATNYMVTIRDEWQGEDTIFTSALLTEPRLRLPVGLLQGGGSYQWVVHARDINGSELLGDFNHGSLSKPARFSIKQ